MNGRTWVPILYFVLGTGLRAHAQEEAALRIENPIARAGTGGKITFRLINLAAGTVSLTSNAWRIERDGMTVFAPPSSPQGASLTLVFSESRSWSWDKTTPSGAYAPAGNYSVVVGPIVRGDRTLELKCDFVLTHSGRLAGTNPLPLSVGNEWTFRTPPSAADPDGSLSSMRVTDQGQGSGWYKVKGTPVGDQTMKMSGSRRRTLWVLTKLGGTSPVAQVLIRFDRSEGTTWQSALLGKVTVVSPDDTAYTPAGTFPHCYCIRSKSTGSATNTYWFARGVGLVQQERELPGGGPSNRLFRAAVRPSAQGGHYSIGQRLQ